MNNTLSSIESQVRRRNYDNPPLENWHPPLSGAIDIEIKADGRWFHEGDEIKREPLVRLFASLLRREEDGEYYLVTPAEKWRIRVEQYPLLVIAVDYLTPEQILKLTLNTGKQVLVSDPSRLTLDSAHVGVPIVSLPHSLSALFGRSAWYQVAALVDDDGKLPLAHGMLTLV